MRIVLDAMGTDDAPRIEVAGAIEALREHESDVELILVGDREVIDAELARHEVVPNRISVHHAPDRVQADDSPASVIRTKPNSSIVVGLELQRKRDADAFVSAGSTGAVMATSLFKLRPLPGVDRPAIGTLLPTAEEQCLLVDAGANVDCKPQHLVQFAHLGNIYAREIMGRTKPRIALLNIGKEPGKGDELSAAAYEVLNSEDSLNFVGNLEGRDIIEGVCDVVVCDGFVGNVLLKFYESVAQFIVGLIKTELGALTENSLDFDRIFRILDYSEIGGAPLLGVGGVSVICHGGSSAKAIRNAIRVAAQAVRSDMVAQTANRLSRSISNAPEEVS
ncbi:MAG TPA: phosphate acyltransferase PlsX [Gemmatimonadetes bacterium]|jgi:glycerol-3-phosphate acyltransferase PlsX|nr:phosphate acyltransferase PlsX [Gemmatimonadota bacterium]HIB00164.1 phosphate acyltransferase PlsX [Gemmatimonadota bacterium]HIC64323.1 phosphate acyltransferase PlsX [Gemmatimonadota bacterium]